MQHQKLTINLCTSHALRSTLQPLFFVSLVSSERKVSLALPAVCALMHIFSAVEVYGWAWPGVILWLR